MTTMTLVRPPDVLKMLAHELRWQILAVLASSDLRVGEIIDFLGQPANLISYHLRLLRSHGLVEARRSDADGRDIYYSLELSHLQSRYFRAGEQLHPALHVDASCLKPARLSSAEHPRILFVCSRNSARSQMAEALLRQAAGEAMEVFSAGTQPSHVDPMAIQVMAERGIDISHQRSKGFEEVAGQPFDYVITVCDRAREACPEFPDHPASIHWSLPNPSEAGSSLEERYRAFAATADELSLRIRFLLSQLGEQSDEPS